jgi:hypothetical protein
VSAGAARVFELTGLTGVFTDDHALADPA